MHYLEITAKAIGQLIPAAPEERPMVSHIGCPVYQDCQICLYRSKQREFLYHFADSHSRACQVNVMLFPSMLETVRQYLRQTRLARILLFGRHI